MVTAAGFVTKRKLTYADSGVNTEEGNRFVSLIKPLVRATHNGNVLKSYGGFSGAYMLPGGDSYLVGAADGVGTKLKIAFAVNKFDTIGEDLVAMCVNDIITCGAKPLFFLDYIATSRLDTEKLTAVVRGMANGCVRAQCALLGGETAEMPGFYADKDFDLAGFAVGIVGKDSYISGEKAAPGDEIVAMPSSGIHSNGYSLVRKSLFENGGFSPDSVPEGFSRPLGDELLEPTRIYAPFLMAALENFNINSIAHITGGGILGNIPRSLPPDCVAVLEKGSWETPAIFKLIQNSANLDDKDMHGIFNCGIGMTLAVNPSDSGGVVRELEKTGCEGASVVGRIERRKKGDEQGVRII